MALGNLRSRAIENSPLKSAEFRAVIGVSLLIMFGFGLIVPTLPLFAKRFGVGEAGVGLLLTVFAATRLAADFIAGNLIDRHGERTMAGVGAAIVGLSSIGAGAAPNYASLVVLRGLGGVGSAFFLGALMAHLIGMVSAEERGRAMSVFQAVLGIGFLLGPVVGGVLAAATDLRTPLFVYGAICLVCAPLVLRVMSNLAVPSDALADPSIEAVPGPAVRAWTRLRPLFSDSAYRAALIGGAAGFYVTGGLQTLIPGFWVDVLAKKESGVGLPFTVLSLASLLVIWHAGSVSDRLGRKVAMVPALALTAVVCVSLGTVRSAIVLVALMGMLGVANGYARPGPTSIVGDVAPPDARGVAVAGYRTAGDVGALIGPLVVGIVAEHLGYGSAFVAIGVVAALAFGAALLARETAPSRRAAAPARA